jgi:hypothetical protein
MNYIRFHSAQRYWSTQYTASTQRFQTPVPSESNGLRQAQEVAPRLNARQNSLVPYRFCVSVHTQWRDKTNSVECSPQANYTDRATASVVLWSEFLAPDSDVPGSIPDATRFFWEVVGLERGPLSLVRITGGLFQGNSGSGLQNRN